MSILNEKDLIAALHKAMRSVSEKTLGKPNNDIIKYVVYELNTKLVLLKSCCAFFTFEILPVTSDSVRARILPTQDSTSWVIRMKLEDDTFILSISFDNATLVTDVAPS